MLIKDKENGKIRNVTNIIIRHNGTIDDFVNQSVCKFFMDNTDPHIFIIEYDNGKDINYVTINFDSVKKLRGMISDIRFRFVKQKKYTIIKIITFLKPKTMIQKEKKYKLNPQQPIKYTIIFTPKLSE